MKTRIARWVAVIVAASAVGVGVMAASGLGAGTEDPVTAARFSLTIDGFQIATFSELSGITQEVVPTEFLESNGGTLVLKKQLGKAKPPTVTLKRAMNGSLELAAWHQAVRTGNAAAARRSCSLTMYDAEGDPVARYLLTNAWPSKLEISGLKAGSSEALIETVTLTADSIERLNPG
jgi:phage tail-like protein